MKISIMQVVKLGAVTALFALATGTTTVIACDGCPHEQPCKSIGDKCCSDPDCPDGSQCKDGDDFESYCESN